jgi:competence ComEA-like helix-hairpin-helix protein
MKWEQFIRDYLQFTQKERIGVLTILFLVFVIIFLPKMVSRKTSSEHIDADTAWISAVKQLEIKEHDPGSQQGDNNKTYQFDHPKNNSRQPVLFFFDPNTLDDGGWNKLGLPEKTIHTIRNYLGKGGRFNKVEDLKKVYGLRVDDYLKLEPFVRIETNGTNTARSLAEIGERERGNKPHSFQAVDINTADTSAFISLPGIGSKLALRIINFRDKLGGFYSVNQVGEVYGLADSIFQKIKQYLIPGNTAIKKINVNTATIDELKAHPYIRYAIAGPIISYRNEHGPFSKIEEIKKVMAVTNDIYDKLAPYLVTE